MASTRRKLRPSSNIALRCTLCDIVLLYVISLCFGATVASAVYIHTRTSSIHRLEKKELHLEQLAQEQTPFQEPGSPEDDFKYIFQRNDSYVDHPCDRFVCIPIFHLK